MEAAVRDYVLEWVDRPVETGFGRELVVQRRTDRIVAVTGPRRAGKTYYFLQLREQDRPNSLYLNFEDIRLSEIDYRQIRDLVRLFVEFTGREPVNILFDEVQNVQNWERALRTLLDLRKYHLYVTGSSSKLLAKEISTHLGGRAFSYIFLPFSFREFLKAEGIDLKRFYTADEAAVLKNHLETYLQYGGFPEVVLEKSEKERILRQYADLILYKDIVERHGIKNISLANFLLSFFLQNFSREFSVNRIYKAGHQVKAGKDTVYSYVDKLLDSLAVFFVKRYSLSVYVRETWPRKAYLCDTGLARLVRFTPDFGRLMENVVFLELLRRTNLDPLLEIYYWSGHGRGEVDFVLKRGSGVEELIQVTYASSRDEIDRRELRSLIYAGDVLGCSKFLVVTWDYEDEFEVGSDVVRCVPLWKWLLGLG
ncbi:MAG: ATP-binding protein [Candidatus Caldarchaeum sp.]|nr:ATP-binding protein [Candidatus Caldarchaeum sp.]MCS7133555.1 ATP-binding protein [Candidatus Caldarchaeum sp.]MCX8200750.1 ATP-binding protein [Candidatus Caldarchaeum sp.]MDW8436171.1 ATP-binding protein [Candidatus Caldarchaeum sp.]